MMKFRGYGLFTLMYLFFCKILTFYVSRNAKIIRLPIFLRNTSLISFGDNFTTGVGCRIDAFKCSQNGAIKIYFGKNVQINDYVHISAIENVYIGDNVLIASKVFISDHNHGCYSGEIQDHPNTPPSQRPIFASPIYIGDNVWIGEFVSILPGVTIGEGSIIGSNSVVTENVPPNSIYVGVPARLLKRFDNESNKWIRVSCNFQS